MKHAELLDENCAIARSSGVIGERWVWVILRQAFNGARRFEDFQRGIGLARNVLTEAILNTARMFGGALGLAGLVALATTHCNHLLKHPTAFVHTVNQALVSGYDLAFLVAACIAAAGTLVAAFVAPKPAGIAMEGRELDGAVAPQATQRATPASR